MRGGPGGERVRGGRVTRVGFIGLGNMGGPMCGHLVRGRLRGDRLRPRLGDALARGATRGSRRRLGWPIARSGAEALITMLPAPAAGRAGAAAGRRCDCSARARLGGDRHEHQLDRRGRARVAVGVASAASNVLDAPVAGQTIGARGRDAGDLRGRRGGPVRARAAAVRGDGRPGADLPHGPARRRLHGQAAAQPAVVHPVGRDRRGAHGRRPRRRAARRLHAALVGSPANSVFLERDVRMVLDDGDYDEAFPMRLVTKDLGLAVELARDVGVPVELTALVEQIHRRAHASLRRRRRRDQRGPPVRGPCRPRACVCLRRIRPDSGVLVDAASGRGSVTAIGSLPVLDGATLSPRVAAIPGASRSSCRRRQGAEPGGARTIARDLRRPGRCTARRPAWARCRDR